MPRHPDGWMEAWGARRHSSRCPGAETGARRRQAGGQEHGGAGRRAGAEAGQRARLRRDAADVRLIWATQTLDACFTSAAHSRSRPSQPPSGGGPERRPRRRAALKGAAAAAGPGYPSPWAQSWAGSVCGDRRESFAAADTHTRRAAAASLSCPRRRADPRGALTRSRRRPRGDREAEHGASLPRRRRGLKPARWAPGAGRGSHGQPPRLVAGGEQAQQALREELVAGRREVEPVCRPGGPPHTHSSPCSHPSPGPSDLCPMVPDLSRRLCSLSLRPKTHTTQTVPEKRGRHAQRGGRCPPGASPPASGAIRCAPARLSSRAGT